MPTRSPGTSTWQGVLETIRARVTDKQFETWFRGVQPGCCTAQLLELTVPNSFSKEWISRRYAEVILNAAEKALGGRRPALRISVRNPEPGEERPRGPVPAPPPEPPAHPAAPLPSPQAREAPPSFPAAHLNGTYRFENLILGPANQLPAAAARAVADNAAGGYTPLFVHGPVGSGKTHLLQAIHHAVSENGSARRVLYVPCEHFVNQYIAAVDSGRLTAFRKLYREADVLLVDDVHHLSQKIRTQEEFLHTFNALYHGGKRVVLTAGSDPALIPQLSEHLSSRFRWGLVCELGAPEVSMRREMVRCRAEFLGVGLPDEVTAYIAEHVCASPRELQGAVTRVAGHAALAGRPPSLELAQEVLRDLVCGQPRRIPMERIAEVVTTRFGVRLPELQGRRRTRAVVVPRQVCMYLARRLTRLSLEGVGGYMGGRDHSTVLYAVEKVTRRMERDERFAELMEQLTAEVLADPPVGS